MRTAAGSMVRTETVPPKVASPTVSAVPGPRSTIVWPISLSVKKEVEWCVKSLESPMGMPSKVTLKSPSWKPRMTGPSASCRPGPLGLMAETDGVRVAMSTKLWVPMNWFWMVCWLTTEVGWEEFSGVSEGAS